MKKIQSTNINRINWEIRASEVRLIGVENKQGNIISLKKAIKKAEEVNADLVEISPNATPPVCKIMDYGKFLYEKRKSFKEQKKKQKIIQIKEIKIRPNTRENDYQVKLLSLFRFLKNGDKVKVTLRFKGREVMHQKSGTEILNRLISDLKELAIVEYFPSKIESRQMTMVLFPKKK